MVGVAAVLLAIGVTTAVASTTTAFGIFNNNIDPAFWGDASVTGPTADFHAWAYAGWGASISGWAIAIIALVHHGIANGLRWAWNAVAAGVLVWFPLDTGYSLYYGVGFNVAIDVFLFAALAVPLAMTWRSTHERHAG